MCVAVPLCVASPCPAASLPALILCVPRPPHVRPSPHGSRYERCWLQLAGRLSDDEMCRLLPPIDVEWQEAYSRECGARVGRVVEQAVFDTSDCHPSHHPATNHAACSSSSGGGREAAEAAARRVWDRLFPHEPYDLCEPRRAGRSQHGGGVGDADDDGARESTQCGRGNEGRGEAQGGPAGEERGSLGEGPRCCNEGAGARCCNEGAGARRSLACVDGRRGEGRGAESGGEPAGASEGSLRGSRTAEASREPGAVDLLASAGVESREAAEGAGEGQHVQYDLRAAVLRHRGLLLEVRGAHS
ncbi:unnamed protein product [Closterium sp. NIES-64]|nr:unnamed protein product [Closterium sp. NIES-64]